jgi:dTDP-4-amino-4,6-dideoxygalactose transaminase
LTANPAIPILDLSPEIESLWEEIREAVDQVIRSGQFILGDTVARFEAEAAQYLGSSHAVAVNSGTDSLVLSLRALGVGPGDEVITTPFTFFATAEAISHVGARPVFADIDPATFNIDPEAAAAAVGPSTKAILPVHLFGRAADMGAILALAQQNGLSVLEDVAQAFGGEQRGTKLGTLGDVGAFSFFPSKNLGAFGDGGLVATDDDDLAESCRMLRSHGAKVKYRNEMLGYNSRLDAIQAAVLRVKLPHIDVFNSQRRAAASRYRHLLAPLPGIYVPEDPDESGDHVYHQFTIRVVGGNRDLIKSALKKAGVSTMVYYPVPVNRLPVYNEPPGDTPHSDQAAKEVLSLPIWPRISEGTQTRVVDALAAALSTDVPTSD